MNRNEDWFTDDSIPDPKSKDLPQPAGWRILVRPVGMVKKTKGGIILTDKNMEEQQYLNSKGRVVAMGRECYNNRRTNWCTTGDTIVYSRYAGSRFKIDGGEVRVLNDDEVIATITDPTNILHHY